MTVAKARKAFFSEEKKQKTFPPLLLKRFGVFRTRMVAVMRGSKGFGAFFKKGPLPLAISQHQRGLASMNCDGGIVP